MALPLDQFKKSYLKALRDGNAAIFAGAGLSKDSGFVDWKQLLRPLAEELALDIDYEPDLLAIAQYHLNTFGRGRINEILEEEFCRNALPNENHRILASLPITTFWTTNYDDLIETALANAGKRVDPKRTAENLAVSKPGYNAVVYKMHGDVSELHRAVLTKEDFEKYNESRQLFTIALQNNLASKTFLFLGFSFDDPNLGEVLSRMRGLLGDHVRPHYCLMREVIRKEGETESEYARAVTRQNLKIRDLARYGIHVVLVQSYGQITEILRDLLILVRRKCIFISGAAEEYHGTWTEQRAREFGLRLGTALVAHGFLVASGYGLGLGDSVIRGVLQESAKKRHTAANALHLGCLPEPGAGPDVWHQYRSEMLEVSGCAIFLFGNKIVNGAAERAEGMVKEFEIGVGKKHSVVPIPVGATGDVAETLWRQVMGNFDQYLGNYATDQNLKRYYEDSGPQSSLPIEELVQRVIAILGILTSPLGAGGQ